MSNHQPFNLTFLGQTLRIMSDQNYIEGLSLAKRAKRTEWVCGHGRCFQLALSVLPSVLPSFRPSVLPSTMPCRAYRHNGPTDLNDQWLIWKVMDRSRCVFFIFSNFQIFGFLRGGTLKFWKIKFRIENQNLFS